MAEFEGWPEELADAFWRVIRTHGTPQETGHPREDARPVVALDFDNTCILGDVGETVHYALCDQFGYALDDDAFWSVIDPEDGRERLKETWAGLRARGLREAAGDPEGEAFATDLIATYVRRMRRLGKESAYRWAPRMHVGMSRTWLHRFSLAHFHNEGARPLAMEQRTAPDGTTLQMQRGLRVRTAFREVVSIFSAHGFDVWVVSATNAWTVQAVAPHLGVSASRIIGNACRVKGDRITDEREGPTTWRAGKVEAIDHHIGRRPVLAIGDTWTDLEMLRSASELAVLVDRGDAELAAIADEAGWPRVAADHFEVEKPRAD